MLCDIGEKDGVWLKMRLTMLQSDIKRAYFASSGKALMLSAW
jgi:hypothetical protein